MQGTAESVSNLHYLYGQTATKYHFEVNTTSNQLSANVGFNIIPGSLITGLKAYVQTGLGIAGFRSISYYQDMRDSLGTNNPNPGFQHWIMETYHVQLFYLPVGLSITYEVRTKFLIGLGVQSLIMRNDDLDLINTPSFSNTHFDVPVNFLFRFGFMI